MKKKVFTDFQSLKKAIEAPEAAPEVTTEATTEDVKTTEAAKPVNCFIRTLGPKTLMKRNGKVYPSFIILQEIGGLERTIKIPGQALHESHDFQELRSTSTVISVKEEHIKVAENGKFKCFRYQVENFTLEPIRITKSIISQVSELLGAKKASIVFNPYDMGTEDAETIVLKMMEQAPAGSSFLQAGNRFIAIAPESETVSS